MDAMKKRGNKRQVTGTVVSDKMDKTVVVQVERMVKYPLYHKYIKRRSRFSSHDEGNACQVSRTKKWRVSKILKKVV
jgi:small subunit ribosomal protein S17